MPEWLTWENIAFIFAWPVHTLDNFMVFIGWLGVLIMAYSQFPKNRANVHKWSFVTSVLKTAYAGYVKAWPLFASWVIYLVTNAIQWFRYGRKGLENKCGECGQTKQGGGH